MDQGNIASHEDDLKRPATLPLELDATYNVVVCSECCSCIALDWVQGHLRSKHGIKVHLDDIMQHLNISTPTLSSTEIHGWLSEVWVLSKPFQGIPIKMGMTCKQCHHSSATKKVMKNHFAAKHSGLKWADNVMRCKVQIPFQGSLRKYIQIEDKEGSDTEMHAGNDWQQALEQDFKEAMGERTSSASNGHSDIRLLSAFIAKMRWDVCIKDMDACELQKLAAAPVRSDRLHKAIICGRTYIEKCCNALNGGNMMVKRHLMSAG